LRRRGYRLLESFVLKREKVCSNLNPNARIFKCPSLQDSGTPMCASFLYHQDELLSWPRRRTPALKRNWYSLLDYLTIDKRENFDSDDEERPAPGGMKSSRERVKKKEKVSARRPLKVQDDVESSGTQRASGSGLRIVEERPLARRSTWAKRHENCAVVKLLTGQFCRQHKSRPSLDDPEKSE